MPRVVHFEIVADMPERVRGEREDRSIKSSRLMQNLTKLTMDWLSQ
ncbi:MAG: hypothetical protein WA323_00900 [Candidatus Nitrosopolaris sp.]